MYTRLSTQWNQIIDHVIMAYQLWARSPEGDKSSTKIGSSRVGIEIGEALPDFLKNRDRDRGGLSKKSGRVEGIGILFEKSRVKSG